jgi:hypothetical protein
MSLYKGAVLPGIFGYKFQQLTQASLASRDGMLPIPVAAKRNSISFLFFI